MRSKTHAGAERRRAGLRSPEGDKGKCVDLFCRKPLAPGGARRRLWWLRRKRSKTRRCLGHGKASADGLRACEGKQAWIRGVDFRKRRFAERRSEAPAGGSQSPDLK